ncbi:MAG TPA: nitronate monooxygenase [Candidatus Nanopelagicaceae bacterium]|nr:nitronate monooxygenase [Candidatus Nanopelagicaceae bacterium]
MAHVGLPTIIQGGMGVGLSNWMLAREVSLAGQLGVVSGTALDAVIARRLQDGDLDGDVRRALSHFPSPEMAARILNHYYVPGGRKTDVPYLAVPKISLKPTRFSEELSVVSNFVEVWLAKEGHSGVVGINFLEKVQMATPPAVFGAMLADVDYVLMGAGVPRELPRLLNDFSAGNEGFISVDVEGATEPYRLALDPKDLLGNELPKVNRPKFLAIVSADVLATYLARDEAIRPDGFVVEGPLAGGHNAPPRGRMVLDDNQEPIYGARDEANLAKMAALGLPFWLAGAHGEPEQVAAAIAAGSAGVQVGTLFALSRESGLKAPLRAELMAELDANGPVVKTDALASPTGFPFKVVQLDGTLSDEAVYDERPRLCDLGYLRTAFVRPNGLIGYRCPSEPINVYLKKGGSIEETVGRQCLCNGLMANIGLGQHRLDGYVEPPILTLGSSVESARVLRAKHPSGWGAADVISWLLSEVSTVAPTLVGVRS